MYTLRTPCPKSISLRLTRLLSVGASNRLLGLKCASNKGEAAGLATGVCRARKPNSVASLPRARAGLEGKVLVATLEDEVAASIDSKGSTLLVSANGRISTGSILDVALAHAAPVHDNLLGFLVVVEVETSILDQEGSVVYVFAAGGVLLRCVDV